MLWKTHHWEKHRNLDKRGYAEHWIISNIWELIIGRVICEAKGWISKRVFQENKARQIFRKTNISYRLIRTRYVSNMSLSNVFSNRNYEVDRCRSKENLFGQSVLCTNVILFFPKLVYQFIEWQLPLYLFAKIKWANHISGLW